MELLERNWRREALYWAAGAAELIWVYAWLLLLFHLRDAGRLLGWISLYGVFLLALYTTRALAWLELELTRERQLIAGLVTASIALLAKVNLYPDLFVLNPRWLLRFLRGILGVFGGFSPEVLAVAAGIYLWWRGITLGQQKLTPAWMRRSFRIGFGAFIALVFVSFIGSGPDFTPWLLAYFLLGLLVLALSRIEDAGGAPSLGGSWLTILAGVLLVIALLWFVTSQVLAVRVLPPLFQLLRPVLVLLERGLIYLFTAVVYVLVWLMRPLISYLQSLGTQSEEQQITEPPSAESILDQLREGVNQIALPDFLVTAFQAILVTSILAVVLWLVVRLFQRQREEGAGEEPALRESVWSGEDFMDDLTGLLRRGWGRLRDTATGRGVAWDRFASDSVRRIYVSLTRLAASLGHPRRDAETPYEYLGALRQALPANEQEVADITDAYVRVRYGEIPASEEELRRLQAEWQRVREGRRGGEDRR